MGKTVEFYFDVGSPSSYLAWTQLPQICADAGASLVYKPMLLGGVFQATGNASPVTVPAKGRYTNMDYLRYAKRYGVPLVMNPHFPIITLHLMRVATGVQMRAPDKLQDFLASFATPIRRRSPRHSASCARWRRFPSRSWPPSAGPRSA